MLDQKRDTYPIDLISIFAIISVMSNYEPQQELTLSDPAQIRAFVHPTRMAILEMLAREELSASMIARQMQIHPANLTRHIKLLESSGLIRLVEKRETGKNLEKMYRAAALHFTVAPADDSPASKSTLVLGILRDNLTSAIHRLQTLPDEEGSGPDVYGAVVALNLTAKDREKFIQKMTSLVDEFSRKSKAGEDLYTLNISLYPGDAAPSAPREINIK